MANWELKTIAALEERRPTCFGSVDAVACQCCTDRLAKFPSCAVSSWYHVRNGENHGMMPCGSKPAPDRLEVARPRPSACQSPSSRRQALRQGSTSRSPSGSRSALWQKIFIQSNKKNTTPGFPETSLQRQLPTTTCFAIVTSSLSVFLLSLYLVLK